MASIESVLDALNPSESTLIIDGGIKSSILLTLPGWRKVIFFDTGKYYPETLQYVKGIENIEVIDASDMKTEEEFKLKVLKWAKENSEIIYGGELDIEGLKNPLSGANIIEIWGYAKGNKIDHCKLYEDGIQNVGDPFAAKDEELSEDQKAEMEQRLKDMGYM